MPPASTAMLPRLKAPAGACDTHMHIFHHSFPKAPTAKNDPPDASVEDYLAMRTRLGVERTVVVQPSAYGTDNRCVLESMAAIGPGARGVAVVDEAVTDAELERLTKLGVCGIRFFMLTGAPLPWEILEAMAARVAPFGWHVQLQLNGRNLPDHEAVLTPLAARLVIEHVGKFIDPVPPDHASFIALLKLIDKGAWIKLSAPYETSKSGPPNYDDVGRLAKRLIAAAPERMVWGTNWPHPSPNVPVPDDAWMLDMLLDWVPDDATRHKILVDNPARLYGF